MSAEKYYIKNSDGEFVEANAISQEIFDHKLGEKTKKYLQKISDLEKFQEKAEKFDELEKEYKEKLDKITNESNDLAKTNASLKLEIDKQKIVREFGLSETLEQFVVGENVDELREKAESLANEIKKGSSVEVNKNEKDDEEPDESRSVAKQLFGSKSDD